MFSTKTCLSAPFLPGYNNKRGDLAEAYVDFDNISWVFFHESIILE
jgi:hypothetical protein